MHRGWARPRPTEPLQKIRRCSIPFLFFLLLALPAPAASSIDRDDQIDNSVSRTIYTARTLHGPRCWVPQITQPLSIYPHLPPAFSSNSTDVIENWVPTNSPTKDLLGLVPGSPPFAGISVCSHQPHLPSAFSSRPFPARDAHYTVSLPAHLICSRPPKSFLICHTLPKKLVVWRFHMLRGSLKPRRTPIGQGVVCLQVAAVEILHRHDGARDAKPNTLGRTLACLLVPVSV